MPRTVQGLFLNMPVADIARTRAFWEALGFAFNPDFSSNNALALELGNGMAAMLLQREFFATFTDKAICDTAQSVEMLCALQLESRAAVDDLVDKALAAGAIPPHPPEDHGFMYARPFLDLDGHGWNIFYMDGTPPR